MSRRNIKTIVKLTKYCCGMLLRWKLELLQFNMPKPKNHIHNKRPYTLEKDISAIKKELDQQHLSESDKDSLHVVLKLKRQEMEEIILYKTAGAILRSKIKWYNEGERLNTKYFHSLEKRHFNCKTIRDLKTENDIRISKDSEILQEAKTELRVPLLLQNRSKHE